MSNPYRVPGRHFIPTVSRYLLMTKQERNDFLLWLKKYFDALAEVDAKAGQR